MKSRRCGSRSGLAFVLDWNLRGIYRAHFTYRGDELFRIMDCYAFLVTFVFGVGVGLIIAFLFNEKGRK